MTEGKEREVETVEEEEKAEAEIRAESESEEEEEREAVDELTALRQKLEETRAKEAEYLDGWQRARAELANARKRFQREQEQAYDNARADVLVRLLPVVDDFERAFETLPADLASLTWVEGVELIRRKLRMLLEQDGVAPIEVVGREFDPFLHQAVTHEPSDGVPAGQIIDELQTGYRMGERVLRPSVVRVSAGPAEPEVEIETESEPVTEG